jgi:heme O synthase-like polyprenyltransferase
MLWYIGTLLPLTASMYFLGITGWISLIVSTLAGLIFLYQGVKLYKSCSTADAKKLMFYSIIYNPVVLLVFILDKVS